MSEMAEKYYPHGTTQLSISVHNEKHKDYTYMYIHK